MKTSMALVVAAVFLAVAMFGPILVAGQGAGSCPVNGECVKECGMAKYQRDPNAYPSLNMNRYKFIRAYYSVLRFLADCYFALVNAIFSLLNHFKPIEHVRWANDSKMLFLSGKQAAKKIRDGMITSRQLVNAYIARIKAVNPLVNGMHFDNFNAALALADQFDANLTAMNAYNRQQLAQTQPLGGVPFTSKMNIHNKGFNISACNAILMNSTGPSTEDAPVVARMKAAGAILLGITTMPNLGLSIAGDDSGCGQINNPHDARRSSGGSSSGEGVLIGAAASPFGSAIGNDIGGSLRVPAHHNGVFGLKPTTFPNHTVPFAGVVPDFAAYPPARAMLTNGPMARYADDLPTLLSVLSGKSLNAYNINVNFRRNFRLFYMEDMDILIAEGLHSEQRDSVRKVKNYFEQEYNMTVQKVNFPLMNRLWELWGVKGISDGLVSISDMPALFKEVHYGPSMNTFLALELAILKDFVFPKDDKETAFVTKKLAKLRAQVNDLLGQDGLLLLPAWPTSTPFHNIEPFTPFNLGHVLLLNQLGNPAIAVPIGKSPITGMPLGVQLAAAPFNEALLIAAARELEKAFGGWVQPGGGPQQ